MDFSKSYTFDDKHGKVLNQNPWIVKLLQSLKKDPF